MAKSRWISTDWKSFEVGDIICDAGKQSFLRLVVYKDEEEIWVAGFVHAALTENNDVHPVVPMKYTELEKGLWGELLKLGNLKDYTEYIDRVKSEIEKMLMVECSQENVIH